VGEQQAPVSDQTSLRLTVEPTQPISHFEFQVVTFDSRLEEAARSTRHHARPERRSRLPFMFDLLVSNCTEPLPLKWPVTHISAFL